MISDQNRSASHFRRFFQTQQFQHGRRHVRQHAAFADAAAALVRDVAVPDRTLGIEEVPLPPQLLEVVDDRRVRRHFAVAADDRLPHLVVLLDRWEGLDEGQADAEAERAASKPSVFNPTYGMNAGPVAPKGRKKPFVLDPLLND